MAAVYNEPIYKDEKNHNFEYQIINGKKSWCNPIMVNDNQLWADSINRLKKHIEDNSDLNKRTSWVYHKPNWLVGWFRVKVLNFFIKHYNVELQEIFNPNHLNCTTNLQKFLKSNKTGCPHCGQQKYVPHNPFGTITQVKKY